MTTWPVERRENPTIEDSLALISFQTRLLNAQLEENVAAYNKLVGTISKIQRDLDAVKARQAEHKADFEEYKISVKGVVELYNTATGIRRALIGLSIIITSTVVLVSNWETIKGWLK